MKAPEDEVVCEYNGVLSCEYSNLYPLVDFGWLALAGWLMCGICVLEYRLLVDSPSDVVEHSFRSIVSIVFKQPIAPLSRLPLGRTYQEK